MTIKKTHGVKIRYMPATNYRPSRYCFEWLGWPSDDMKPVRRYVSADSYSGPTDDSLLLEAAGLYIEWLSAGPKSWEHGDWTPKRVKSITMAHSFDAKCDVIAIETENAQ